MKQPTHASTPKAIGPIRIWHLCEQGKRQPHQLKLVIVVPHCQPSHNERLNAHNFVHLLRCRSRSCPNHSNHHRCRCPGCSRHWQKFLG